MSELSSTGPTRERPWQRKEANISTRSLLSSTKELRQEDSGGAARIECEDCCLSSTASVSVGHRAYVEDGIAIALKVKGGEEREALLKSSWCGLAVAS